MRVLPNAPAVVGQPSALVRRCTVVLGAIAALLAPAHAQQGRVLIPNQMHTSLVFELHSVHDDVEIYEGDPQYLFRLDLRPINSIPPKIDFSNTNQAAVLRVLDLWALALEKEPVEVDEEDPDLPPPRDIGKPVSQTWSIRILPSSATDFILQCDRGKADLDFTDLAVRSVHLLADTTEVKIDFKRPNRIPLERFKATVRNGEISLRTFLHSRAETATLQIDGSKCELDLTGEPPPGVMDLFVEGVPQDLLVEVSEEIGLHVEGPAAVVTRFARSKMVRRDLALESDDFDTRKNRIRLYFSRAAPKLKVQWTE